MKQSTATGAATPPRLTQARGFGAERQALEAELERHGVALPISQLVDWLRVAGSSDAILTVVRDAAGAPAASTVAAVARSRALPGHHRYRVEQFSSTPDAAVDDALLAGIANAARRDARCLRLTVELLERDAARRSRLADTLSRLGFRRAATSRSYRYTLVTDLAPGEAALFAALNGRVRRGVRAPAKRGLELRQVDDPIWAPRLNALMCETFERTGGTAPSYPWPAIIELSRRYPARSRVCAIFDPAVEGQESLLGFGWGTVNGTRATFEAGASTRRADLGGTPLTYTTMWDLIAWSCRTPATWFDFGGVTPKDAGPDDPLAGISEFKRFFSDDSVEVGEDWTLEPRPVRGAIARAAGAIARRVVKR